MFMAVLLVGCSDDSDRVDGETDVLQLVPYTRGMEVSPAATRTVTLPGGYSNYEGPNSIGVYMTTADAAPEEVRSFSYAYHAWNSQVNVTNGTQYYIYGYMPVNENVNCTISKRPESKPYSEGAVLSFNNLPPVMAGDFSVITGVQQVSSATPENDSQESVSLTAGNFSYRGRASGQNFVCLMLDHLYSCVRFKFLVDATYNELRTIKLKEVKLKTEPLLTYPLAVTMIAGGAFSPVWGEPTSYSSDFVTLFSSVEGEALPASVEATEQVEVDGYFAPFTDVSNNFVLKCTYDVYDKDENCTRVGCVAVNKLPADVVDALENRRTVFTLTVTPTYLYVLSEPDLDNPTIEVKSE